MAVHQAWRDHYADAMPANLIVPIDGLTVECGPAAVIHGIVTSKSRNSRNFQYIASCARNYVPEPPTASYAIDLSRRSTPSYAVEPISAQPFDLSPTPAARPAPLAHDDPWRICLAELSMTLPNMAVTYLAGSVLEPAGEVPAANGAFVPLYRVVVGECAAAGLGWLKHQGAEAIRRRLSSVLGQSVLVEIAVDEPRPASDPP